MGTFSYTIEVGDPQGERFETLEALVDTGAGYTTLPRSLLHRLGVRPFTRRQFRLADERVVERDVGQTVVRINDKAGVVLVVFEEEGKQSAVGWHTLDSLFLKVDADNQRLVPAGPIPWHEHERPVPRKGD